MGPFNVDLMACTVSVLCFPLTGEALPFFSQFDCAGSAGTDVFAHVPSFRVPVPWPSGFVSLPQSWQATLRNTWRNARPEQWSFCRMLRLIGSLWCS